MGTPVDNCQWPTTVLLLGGGGCTGTLVHPQLVTTAAHCGYVNRIRFGESQNSVAREVAVDHCLRNPDYSPVNNGVNGTDFAYCKLAEPVYDIPITPPVYGCETEIISVNRPAVIAGFGNDTQSGGFGPKRWAETRIAAVSMASNEVVVGEVGTAACSGDSGGPAYVQYPDGSWHTFGIVSGGPPCGTGADVYALLHGAIPWIEENSGIDITPCHDVDGTWNPTPECQGFALDPLTTEPSWNEWCSSDRLGPAATCGEAFNAAPDDVPPVVEILTPTTGEVFDGPTATVDITVDAFDEGNGLKVVTLFVNGQEVASDSIPPYEFKNAQFPEGGWIVTATAEDWNENIGESEPVAFGVGQDAPETPGEDEGGGGPGQEDDFGSNEVGSDGCTCSAPGARTDTGGPLAFGLALFGLAALRRRSTSA